MAVASEYSVHANTLAEGQLGEIGTNSDKDDIQGALISALLAIDSHLAAIAIGINAIGGLDGRLSGERLMNILCDAGENTLKEYLKATGQL
jgi:hypothetical protein